VSFTGLQTVLSRMGGPEPAPMLPVSIAALCDRTTEVTLVKTMDVGSIAIVLRLSARLHCGSSTSTGPVYGRLHLGIPIRSRRRSVSKKLFLAVPICRSASTDWGRKTKSAVSILDPAMVFYTKTV